MVTREFGVGSFGAGSTSCKISRVVPKRQVNKVKTMDINYGYIFMANLWYIICVLARRKVFRYLFYTRVTMYLS